MEQTINDWSTHSIKLEQLHKRLDHSLNLKHSSEAFSILLDMQAEVLKLQQYVLYGIDVPNPKYESKVKFESLLESARNDKEFIKELQSELMKVNLPMEITKFYIGPDGRFERVY